MLRKTRSIREVAAKEGTFYPISPEDLERIFAKLRPQSGIINVLDPFCYRGEALAICKKLYSCPEIDLGLYGTEKERVYWREARKIATKVVLGGYEGLQATSGVFSVLYLNPPVGGINFIGMRREVVAFSDTTLPGKYLYPGSVMILIITPELLPQIANHCLIRFEKIRTYQLGDRVVVYGVKSRGRVPAKTAEEQKEDLLTPRGWDDEPYIIPPAEKHPGTFRGYVIDDEELAEDLGNSLLNHEVEKIIKPKSSVIKAPKPLLPLNTTHIAIAAAAGAINGRAGNHYRKGITKENIETIELQEDDTVTTINTKRYVSRVRIFAPSGVYDLDY